MSSSQCSYSMYVESISKLLEDCVSINTEKYKEHCKKSLFDGNFKKEATIKNYICWIIKCCMLEINTLKYAMILLEKFCSKKALIMTNKNCFKLIFISILISMKLNQDYVLSDKDMSFVAGFSQSCMAQLEMEFLECFDYRVAQFQ